VEIANICKTFCIIFFPLLISGAILTKDLDIENTVKVKKILESFIYEGANICDNTNEALKAALYARQANLIDTSSRILENLIRCDSNKELYYKELTESFAIDNNEKEALYLLEFAKKNLETDSYKDLKEKFNKSFRKFYYDQSYKFIPTYTDNYNSGLYADYIYIYDFPFKVDEKSKPKSGIGMRSSYGLKLNLPSKEKKWDSLELNLGSLDFPGREGDVFFSAITHNKKFDKTHLLFSISNLRVRDQKYLDSVILGINPSIANKKEDSIRISLKRDEYINDFQTGKGLKLGYLRDETLLKDIFYERYIANSSSYSYKSIGFKTKRFSVSSVLAFDVTFDKNTYDNEFAVFQNKRKGRNFKVNIFSSKIKGYFFKLSLNRRKSNIQIFDNKSINFDIILN
tara:strand:- start:66 stop:1265 length:1200 start_codon:yes stop_codon:yes gene_type:complete